MTNQDLIRWLIVVLLLLIYMLRDSLSCDLSHVRKRDGFEGSDQNDQPVPTGGNVHAMSFMDVDADAMYEATLRPLAYQLTDTNYKYGPLTKGLYGGDVPAYLFTDFDDRRSALWRVGEHGIYWPNSKEYWKDNNMPTQAAQWVKRESGIYKPQYQPTYP
jgi:hypothetical protein